MMTSISFTNVKQIIMKKQPLTPVKFDTLCRLLPIRDSNELIRNVNELHLSAFLGFLAQRLGRHVHLVAVGRA